MAEPLTVRVVVPCDQCGGARELYYTNTTTRQPEPCRKCGGSGEGVSLLPLDPTSREARELELGRRVVAKELALEAWANSPQDDDALFIVYHEATVAYSAALRALDASEQEGKDG